MVVDNHDATRDSIADSLRDQYEITAVSSPREAEEVLAAREMDAAVIDVHLLDDDDKRDLSGLELAERVNGSLPKIIITANDVTPITPEFMRKITQVARSSYPAYVGFCGKQEFSRTLEPLEREIERALMGQSGAAPARDVEEAGPGLISEIDKLLATYSERLLNEFNPARLEAAVRASVLDEIKDLILGPKLDNYRGYVCARMVVGGQEQSDTPVISPGESCRVDVWFQPEEPQGAIFDSVDIVDGQDTSQVSFEVKLDSDTVRLDDRTHTFELGIGEPPVPHSFFFTAPDRTDEHEVYAEVFQKNRLIQSLTLVIEIAREAGGHNGGGTK